MTMIDLDQNATTPLDPDVLEAMRPHWLASGNAESRHGLGRRARRAWDQAIEIVASVLNASPSEVVFTSGGTEANNLALFGLADPARGLGQIVLSPIEHPAVAEPIARLKTLGFVVDCGEVNYEGIANVESMPIGPTTRVATLMLANNETGAIQPVHELVAKAKAWNVPVHTDAVQAVGKIPVDFHALDVATLACSAHKFHGPAGVGALLIRKGVNLTPMFFGGSQQRGLRPGTVPVALAVGLSVALEKADREGELRRARWIKMRDALESGLIEALGAEHVIRNGPLDDSLRLPQTLNVAFPSLDGDALLIGLDQAGIAASLGSACASGATRPSPTLVAMGLPRSRLRSSVRLSLGAFTSEDEIPLVIRQIAQMIRRMNQN